MVPLSTHVEVALADEVKRLAAAGNRSVSRELAAAIKEHVERELAPDLDALAEG